MLKLPVVLLTIGAVAAPAEKAPPTAKAADARVAITATLYLGKEAVRAQLGSDLDGYFILVDVNVAPMGGEPLTVNRDDFLLRSFKDGQKSQPFAPSQIAGRDALVVSSAPDGGGGVMTQRGGPTWGGMGGPPLRLPGSDVGVGTAPSDTTASATVRAGGVQKEDPVLAVLKKKALPERETRQLLSGLLYFSLEGKYKPKDLVLEYNSPAGRLRLKFR
ncbi:MAG: hypothetical protein ABSD56_08375 [Bryobacteraceae bacterium]